MKDLHDSKTIDLLPQPKRRGRPSSGTAKSNAERQAAYREKHQQLMLSARERLLLLESLAVVFASSELLRQRDELHALYDKIVIPVPLDARRFLKYQPEQPAVVTVTRNEFSPSLDETLPENVQVEESVTVTKNDLVRPGRTPHAVYAHPSAPSLTWSGRGRKPVWVLEMLAQGMTLEQLKT